MHIKKTHLINLLSCISLVIYIRAYAETIEEIGYDQLVQELSVASTKRSLSEKAERSNPFIKSQVHASFGYVDSIQTLNIGSFHTTRFIEGVAFGLGVDLIPGLLITEGTFENYGKTYTNSSEIQLRQFALRGVFEKPVNSNVNVRIINGLAVRTFKFTDDIKQIQSKKSAPHYLLGIGFNTWITSNLQMGAEFTGQTALVNDPIIKNALSVGLKINAIF